MSSLCLVSRNFAGSLDALRHGADNRHPSFIAKDKRGKLMDGTESPPAIVPADTVWVIVACAMVLLMTPALAFFYGGLVRSKNALNTMMMSFAALGAVGVAWALLGYSLAFAPGNPFVGGLSYALLNGVGLEAQGSVPHLLFMAFQGTFAIITAALISGAVAERMRFSAYLAFIVLWSLAVYAPVAHWVWGGGFLARLGALDYAGGTVVHVNAGIAAVVAALVVGQRRDYGRLALLPHNVPFVLLGAGLLWFGWFGFNAGSALSAGSAAALAFVNTLLAPAAALSVWMLLDLAVVKRPTAVGAATGIVVGLVAITPAAGFVGPLAAMALGGVAVLPSYFAILRRSRTGLDDSLDVAAAHGLGGLSGALLTGVLASTAWGPADGLAAGNARQLWVQALAVLAPLLYSGAATYGLLKLVGLFLPLRASAREESRGLDVPLHGEEAYARGEGAVLLLEPPARPMAVSAMAMEPALAAENGGGR
jgi:ammonium transporter, Amt family